MDPDLLLAIAALVGPTIAAFVGVIVYRYRRQVEEIDQVILQDGIQSFHTSLYGLLSAHLLNYQIAGYIIKYLRTYRIGELLTPESPPLPRFVGVELDSLPISPLLPLQEVVGDKVILDWGMLALSDTTLEPKELDIQIRQPVVAYYGADLAKGTLDVDELVQQLTALMEVWNEKLATHFALLDRLYDLKREITRKRPWRVSGYYALSKRMEIAEIRQKLKEGTRPPRRQAIALIRS